MTTSHPEGPDSGDGRWRIVQVTSDDYPIFDQLFQESFGGRMSEAEWRWKYGPHPGQALFGYQGAQPVAHYGCLTQRVLLFGQEALALQPVDVLVAPRERGILTRRGVMFQLATSLFESLFGPGRRHPIGMGFPTTRHLLLAERLNLFKSAGRLVDLSWLPDSRPLPWTLRVLEGAQIPGERLNRAIDRLWRRMAPDLRQAVVLVRDAQRIRYRYLQHPSKSYQAILIRSRLTGQDLGLMIVRRDADRFEWVDYVGPLSSIPLMVRVGRRLAAAEKAQDFHAWVSESFGAAFQATGPCQTPTDVHNLTLTWVPTEEGDRIRSRWWLMAGDTDFR